MASAFKCSNEARPSLREFNKGVAKYIDDIENHFMGFGENRSSASLACRKGGLAIGQSFGQKKLRGLLSLQVRQDITTLCSKIVVAELRPKFAVPWYRL